MTSLGATCLAVALSAGLTPAPVAASPAPSGIPKDAAKAYKQMGCKFGNVITSHGGGGEPRFKGVTCFVKGRGNFEIDHYYKTKAGRSYWLDYYLGGSPDSWVTLKGHLVITNSKSSGRAYDEGLARYAAKRIDGRAAHGR